MYPKNVSIDFGGDGIDASFSTIIHDVGHVKQFKSGVEKENIQLPNSSQLRYLKIPQYAKLVSAKLKIGNSSYLSLNTTVLLLSESTDSLESTMQMPPDSTLKMVYGSDQKANNITGKRLSPLDFNPMYSWSNKCSYDFGGVIQEISTRYDRNDLYFDYDEENYTVIDGTNYDQRVDCDYITNWCMDTLKLDTDDRDGNDDYDQVWSGPDCDTGVERIKSISIDDSSGSQWGIGWTYCIASRSGYTDAWAEFYGCGYETWNIQECIEFGFNYGSSSYGYHIGCDDDEECYDPETGVYANYCRTPPCSPSCSEWEHETYGNHACTCALDSGRCDTSKYGWQNVEEDEYCDANHYPSSVQTINCSDTRTWTIINHVETCSLAEGRCETPDTQINGSHYCDSWNYTMPVGTKISINGSFIYYATLDEIDDVDLKPYIESYLEKCIPDDQGYCDVPIEFTGIYNTSFLIDSIDINFEIPDIDFSEALQAFSMNCSTDTCNYPITISSQSGKVNVSQVHYYSPQTRPIINTSSISVGAGSVITIDVADAENDSLLIETDNDYFFQSGSSAVWFTSCDDIGEYEVSINATDGIQTDAATIQITLLQGTCPYSFVKTKSDQGEVTSRFSYSGDIWVASAIEQNSTHNPTANSEWIMKTDGEPIFILDQDTGDLYLDGQLYQNQQTISTTSGDDFIMRDAEGNIVLLVDPQGNMYITGVIK